ncbi:MAG TPA: adenine phosphoribosyltransferase [Steroidobacteraceae bacterium]|jgi:adenine phosphoribosyltransferase|nr:adenine phosphoribosyltransferase [Steroidobacteraceae bacterium]
MHPLARHVADVPDFPQPGILFRDVTPLLRDHFGETVAALDGLWSDREWAAADAVAGVESRGFILAAALAERRGKGFVPVRKKGKLPPPVIERHYALEYGTGILEMQRGTGRLILVDDVLATGGTLSASAELAMDAGYRVLHAGVLIDLGIVRNFRCAGQAPRALIRYGG